MRLLRASLLKRVVASERSLMPAFKRVPMPGRWGAWRKPSRMSRFGSTMSFPLSRGQRQSLLDTACTAEAFRKESPAKWGILERLTLNRRVC